MSADSPDSPAAVLSAQLEASLLRELTHQWQSLNGTFFNHSMAPPVFALTDGETTLGRWDGASRRMLFQRSMVVAAHWSAVLEVLKHEMAHQFVHEVLGVTDESAHGPTFVRVCEDRGFDALAAGMPDGEPDEERQRLLRRVSNLLALAQSSNQHEAENAAAAAQKLLLRHNIELCNSPNQQRYAFRHVGEPKSRHQEAEHLLAGILVEHFFVRAIWVSSYRPTDEKRGSVLELCGSPENLDIAVYVHGFLADTAERLWKEHKKANGIRRNRDRRAFIAGVMEGFGARLKLEKLQNVERGLVWVGDADLKRYYRQRHPHIRSVRLQGQGYNQARMDGRSAGNKIVLRKGVKGNTSNGGKPRALPRKT